MDIEKMDLTRLDEKKKERLLFYLRQVKRSKHIRLVTTK